jgi:hypothetical protein
MAPASPVGDPVERLVPPDPDPFRVGAGADPPDRVTEPVGVLVDVRERDALGTDVPA